MSMTMEECATQFCPCCGDKSFDPCAEVCMECSYPESCEDCDNEECEERGFSE